MRASILTVLACLAALVFLLPFLWAGSMSIRPSLELYAPSGWGIPLLDFAPTFEAWPAAFAYPDLGRAAGYSVGISAAATVLALALGMPAAWALAPRGGIPRADLVVVGFLVVRLLPPIALVIPYYFLAAALDLLDHPLSLVLVNATLVFPLVVVMLRQAFADLPRELQEAASIDGAGPLCILVRIVLPLAAPAMVATALIVFAFVWNDFLFASSLSSLRITTLPVLSVGGWAGGVRQSAVGMLVCMSVPLVAALLAQRWLVSSLTLGAVKG
ncbi:MAG: carbohydrate ABC transporter permease [Geminicoccaceae bacterium]